MSELLKATLCGVKARPLGHKPLANELLCRERRIRAESLLGDAGLLTLCIAYLDFSHKMGANICIQRSNVPELAYTDKLS